MTLRRRIDRLEGTRPDPALALDLDLDLDPDLAERIRAAKAAGTFPASLSMADLDAINDAFASKEQGASHDRE